MQLHLNEKTKALTVATKYDMTPKYLILCIMHIDRRI